VVFEEFKIVYITKWCHELNDDHFAKTLI